MKYLSIFASALLATAPLTDKVGKVAGRHPIRLYKSRNYTQVMTV